MCYTFFNPTRLGVSGQFSFIGRAMRCDSVGAGKRLAAWRFTMDKNEKRPFGVIDGDMPLEMDADTKSLLVMKELFLGVKARVEGDEEEHAILKRPQNSNASSAPALRPLNSASLATWI